MLILFIDPDVENHIQVDKVLGKLNTVMHAYSAEEALKPLENCTDAVGCVLYAGKERHKLNLVVGKIKEKQEYSPTYQIFRYSVLRELQHKLKSN